MHILNMVWPAIYVAAGLKQFWHSILGTILIEWLILQLLLHLGWKKSLPMSVVGNIVSGLSGIYIMPSVMLVWHLIADSVLGGTFNAVNWLATYILMCIGSVYIEVFVVKLIWRVPAYKMIVPMMVGNLCSYAFLLVQVFTDKIRI